VFFKGDFYHLLASHGFLKGVKYSSNKKRRRRKQDRKRKSIKDGKEQNAK